MISFTLCLAALIIFYFVYGKFVEKIFQPDNRKTPAFTKCDNVDFMPLPGSTHFGFALSAFASKCCIQFYNTI